MYLLKYMCTAWKYTETDIITARTIADKFYTPHGCMKVCTENESQCPGQRHSQRSLANRLGAANMQR